VTHVEQLDTLARPWSAVVCSPTGRYGVMANAGHQLVRGLLAAWVWRRWRCRAPRPSMCDRQGKGPNEPRPASGSAIVGSGCGRPNCALLGFRAHSGRCWSYSSGAARRGCERLCRGGEGVLHRVRQRAGAVVRRSGPRGSPARSIDDPVSPIALAGYTRRARKGNGHSPAATTRRAEERRRNPRG